MKQGVFVLENRFGKQVRVFDWKVDKITIIQRLDNHRIESIGDLKELDRKKIKYRVLAKATLSSIKKNPLILGELGKIVYVDKMSELDQSVNTQEDSDRPFFAILRWAAVGHLAALLLIMLLGTYVFSDKDEEELIVTVVPQQQREVQPVVTEVRETRPTPTKQQATQAKTKPKTPPKKVAQRPKKAPTKKADTRQAVDVNNVGALGALGGANERARGRGGVNLNAASNTRGSDSSGQSARGGLNQAMKGQGLVAGNRGSGDRAQGAGGHGTRGRAGGQEGYGKMSMAGSSSAYTQSLSEEALVEGGLSRDQIAAVINRHLSQVRYCYEKGLQSEPSLAGRVAVRFVINELGQVNTARVGTSSLRSSSVENCIVSRLRGWQFPKPVGNVQVRVTYPFVLSRLS